MKTVFNLLFTIGILSCTYFSVNGQFLNNEEAKNLKKSHVILGLTDNEDVNEIFRNAVKEFWTLTEIQEEMPVKEAISKVKSDGSVTVIMLGSDVSKRSSDMGNGWTGITKASSLYIGLNTKGHSNANLMQHTRGWSEEQLVFGLTTLQDAIEAIITHNLSGMAKVKDVYDERSPSLKNFTLLIDKSTMDPKLTEAIIAENYTHPFELVSHEDWVKAIMDKQEGSAYINIIPVPVGDKIAYLGYVISCNELEAFMYFRSHKNGALSSKSMAEIMKATTVK